MDDATVVALGEAVHTSGGFYQAKHRLIRQLVEVQGFRVVAFESPRTMAETVAGYVSGGQGDATTAVTEGLFPVWASQSVLDLVTWLRAYNEDNPDDPVAFFGFDTQQPWDDGLYLMAFNQLVLPAQMDELNGGIAQCNGATYASEAEYDADPNARDIDEESHAACNEGLDAVLAAYTANEADILSLSSPSDLAWARMSVDSLRSYDEAVFQNAFENDVAAANAARDVGMAAVFQAMMEQRHPGQKAVIWAHNWHISQAHDEVAQGSLPFTTSMGTLLRQEMGDDYRAIGLAAYQISTNWPDQVGVGPLDPPTAEDNVQVMLHGLERDLLLVDLEATEFFEQDVIYEFGSMSAWYIEFIVPLQQYTALVYLDDSPMMDALMW